MPQRFNKAAPQPFTSYCAAKMARMVSGSKGNEMFAGARILSNNTGETLSSALNSETATGFEIYTNKPASQSGSPASTQRYTFSIDGVQQGDVEVLQGADLIRAELALRQDLDADGFKGIQIAGTEPLGNAAPWNMPMGHSPRVYSTNTEYLLISTRTGLTPGSDLSTGSLTDTHALLTTDRETTPPDQIRPWLRRLQRIATAIPWQQHTY